MEPIVCIYADGACSLQIHTSKKDGVLTSAAYGPGGWAAIILFKKKMAEIYGYEPDTTNNRMELLSCIKGLEALVRPCVVRMYSDSNYVVLGMTKWILSWKSRDWVGADKKTPVKNRDLWERLDELCQTHNVEFFHVKGHNRDKWNDRADELAVMAKEQQIAS